MNWTILDAAGTWVGAIAVVVTLFYLAQQIKLNAKQVERQINADIGTRIFQAYDPIYQGRNAEIMVCGLRDDGELSDADRYVFDLLLARQHGAMMELCDGIETGDFPERLAGPYSRHFQDVLLDYPGAKKWFRARQDDTRRTVQLLRLDIDS